MFVLLFVKYSFKIKSCLHTLLWIHSQTLTQLKKLYSQSPLSFCQQQSLIVLPVNDPFLKTQFRFQLVGLLHTQYVFQRLVVADLPNLSLSASKVLNSKWFLSLLSVLQWYTTRRRLYFFKPWLSDSWRFQLQHKYQTGHLQYQFVVVF